MANLTSEYIFETATSDAGMTKQQAIWFHVCNPNGSVKQLPEGDDFCHNGLYFYGLDLMYSAGENYHAKWFSDALHKKPSSFTKWDIAYHAKGIAKDIEKFKIAIAEKKAA